MKTLGTCAVTVTASPSCSLPDYAMTGTYDAMLAQSEDGGVLVVEFLNAMEDFVGWGGNSGFTGTREGETVRFTINGDYLRDGHSFVALHNGMEIHYDGSAVGTFDEKRTVTTFAGDLVLRSWAGWIQSAVCAATDHQIVLVRK